MLYRTIYAISTNNEVLGGNNDRFKCILNTNFYYWRTNHDCYKIWSSIL